MKKSHVLSLITILAALLAFRTWGNRAGQNFQLAVGPIAHEGRNGESEAGPSAAGVPAAMGAAKPAGKQHGHSASALLVSHQPQQPRSGQPVLITLDCKTQPLPGGDLFLEYQVVDPGKYIALRDPAFNKAWVSLPMTQPKALPGSESNRVFTAQLPADLQKHRRLIRYRVRSAKLGKVIAPDPSDAQHNFAYFVYEGVPPWTAAINPRASDQKLRTPVTYSSEVLQRVPVYQFISSKAAVEAVTWTEPDQFGDRDRNAYRYTGTMVYDGVVYDHVPFRARGGMWRHAMGKNMWKFNFLPGHRFEARDEYGRRYETKWDKLNLGACIQQADFGMRGEQGMFEAVGFRLFNLAGMEAPHTHWVHLRIIDQPEESPANQYAGDFWGLYLAVENVDEHFLKAHDLPPGNLYKIESGARTEFNGNPAIADQRDVHQFLRATSGQPQPDGWWEKNVDLSRYYNYRSIIECIHHYDVDGGKNYFYYLNPVSGKWVVLPWDIDLTWGDQMCGSGYEPFYRSRMLSRAPFKQQYQERLAEIRDLLYNPEQIGRLIDEYAAMIDDPKEGPSLADADRAKWDYNPIMNSRYVMEMKAGQGRFYFGNPNNTFRSMVDYMKGYASKRARWIDSRLLSDYRPPAAPTIAPNRPLKFSDDALTFNLASAPESGTTCRWRLAEVTAPSDPTAQPRQPGKYEIQSLWEQEINDPQAPAALPTRLLAPGHTYRVRVRSKDSNGLASRWSAPVQFTVPKS